MLVIPTQVKSKEAFSLSICFTSCHLVFDIIQPSSSGAKHKILKLVYHVAEPHDAHVGLMTQNIHAKDGAVQTSLLNSLGENRLFLRVFGAFNQILKQQPMALLTLKNPR